MPAYLLTRPEAWTLATLLHLPVQPGSVLNAWLNDEASPTSVDLADENLAGLAGKGYYSPQDKEQPIKPELLSSLTLAAVNAVEITAVIWRNGQSALTRFAQVGKGFVQYGIDETNLSLHPVIRLEALVEKILPDWFTASKNEHLQANLPMGAFLLFKEACALTDLAAAESNLESEKFEKSRLLAQFNHSTGWVELFNTEEARGNSPVNQARLEEYCEMLLSMGYLHSSSANIFEIGPTGRALAISFSDPDLCSLIVSLQTWQGKFPDTGVFLFGDNRLFLLELKSGHALIRQLADRREGSAWVQGLLVKGSKSRYSNYIIAPA